MIINNIWFLIDCSLLLVCNMQLYCPDTAFMHIIIYTSQLVCD